MSDQNSRKEPCRCNCGYRCGGPGYCELDPIECLQQTDGKHFVRDCEHEWTEWVELENGGTAACKCGVTAMGHDMLCGP